MNLMQSTYLLQFELTPARVVLRALAVGIALGVAVSGAQAADPAERGVHATGPVSATDVLEQILQPVTDWLERANQEYQTSVVKELSVPTGKGAPLESAKAPLQPSREPGVIDQVKGLLGIEGDRATPKVPEIAAKDAAERTEAVKRQIEARQQEQERLAEAVRNAEKQRLALEAKKLAEADALTRQSQKTAELARLAEDERRKGGKPAIVTAEASADKAAAEKSAAERKVAEKAAADKVAAENAASKRKVVEKVAADKVAADKAASERKIAEKAAADKVSAEKAASERKVVEKVAADKVAADKAAAERKVAEKATADRAGALAAAATAAFDSKLASGDGVRRGTERSAKSRKVASSSDRGTKRTKVAANTHGKTEHGRCSRAGRDVDIPAIYVVKSGDTLWDISRRYYDKGIRFEKIVRANGAKIASPDLIFPCQKVYLPGRAAFFLVLPMEPRDAS